MSRATIHVTFTDGREAEIPRVTAAAAFDTIRRRYSGDNVRSALITDFDTGRFIYETEIND